MARDPRTQSSTIAPLALSVPAAAARLGLSRSACYVACADFLAGKPGGLPCVRVRHRVLIPIAALEAFLAVGTNGYRSSEVAAGHAAGGKA